MMYYLFLLGFFAIFSTTIAKNPVLPLFSQALGANDVVIGLVAAVSPLAGILFSFPVGVLSDQIGRKKTPHHVGSRIFVCPAPVPAHHRPALAYPGPVLPWDGHCDPWPGHLRGYRRTVPGEQRCDAGTGTPQRHS